MLFAILLFLATPAHADTLELNEVSIKYQRFQDGARNPLFFDSSPKDAIALNLKTNVLTYFYWDNVVHSATNQYQFYTVGWQYQLGLRVSSYLDVFVEHHSQHVLDTTYPYMRFPVENSVGVTIYLYGGRGKAVLP